MLGFGWSVEFVEEGAQFDSQVKGIEDGCWPEIQWHSEWFKEGVGWKDQWGKCQEDQLKFDSLHETDRGIAPDQLFRKGKGEIINNSSNKEECWWQDRQDLWLCPKEWQWVTLPASQDQLDPDYYQRYQGVDEDKFCQGRTWDLLFLNFGWNWGEAK